MVLRFQTVKREVWITIDDGPHPIDTPLILNLLAQYKASATFFVIGSRAERYPELIFQIRAQGHTIGNHTQTHPSNFFWIATPAQIENEVQGCARSLAVVTANDGMSLTRLFRAPVGMINFFIQPCMKRHGLTVVGWSARGFDSQEKSANKIVEKIWKDVSPGCIILLHEGHHEKITDLKVNPAALDSLLKKLTENGYACVIPRDEQFLKS